MRTKNLFERKTVAAFVLGCLSVLAALGIAVWPAPKTGLDFSDTGSGSGDCCNFTSGDFSSRPGGFGDIGRLIERAPEEKRKLLLAIFHDLLIFPEDVLYVLKSEDDPCAATEMIDCREVPTKYVKPLVDAALDHRKAQESLEATNWSNRVALGSCIISLLALVISFLKFWRSNPNNPQHTPPVPG
jgi:hypothetical protein